MKVYFSIFIITLFAIVAKANVRLPNIIGSHMVLLQKCDVKLWGWSDAQEKIIISTSWDTVTYRTTGSRNATWSVIIKTPVAGGPYTITIKGWNTVLLEDVLIGEVWLCSGQSNMEWSGDANCKQVLEEMPNATNTAIRLFKVTRATSDYPQDDAPGHWVVCNPEDMKHFSAVGYFFGKQLNHELNLPVGMISASWGGTPAEVWTPASLVNNDPVLKESADKKSETFPGWPYEPGKAYNAMIHPLTNFNIAGALWYQGESNVGTYASYKTLLSAMLTSWRKEWGKDFPFYYVQIAPYAYGWEYEGVMMRETLTSLQDIPHTGMVVVSDLVDDVNNIHPNDKLNVGLRLANYALADTYYKITSYRSPQYQGMIVNKNKVRISFKDVPTTLKTRDSKSATEFQIAGEDQKFVPAEVKIEKNTIVVWSKTVAHPVAVRFGYSNTSTPNLSSAEGLPVNLFRTDSWPITLTPVKK